MHNRHIENAEEKLEAAEYLLQGDFTMMLRVGLTVEIHHLVVDGTYSVSKLSNELIEEILETTERGD